MIWLRRVLTPVEKRVCTRDHLWISFRLLGALGFSICTMETTVHPCAHTAAMASLHDTGVTQRRTPRITVLISGGGQSPEAHSLVPH